MTPGPQPGAATTTTLLRACACAILLATTAIRAAEDQPPPPATAAHDRLADHIKEILTTLAEHYPESLHLTPPQKTQLLAQIAAFFPGIEYREDDAAQTDTPPGTTAGNDGKPYPGVIISSHQILYVRLDNFRKSAVGKAREDILSADRLARHPVGIVLDLRAAAGNDYAGVAQMLRLFRTEPAEDDDDQPAPDHVRLPVILLLGGETAGAAEVFATLLERAGNAMTMGQPTAGHPFPRLQVRLHHGGILLIPDVPAPLRHVPATPVSPTVNAQSGPQVAYDRIAGTVDDDHHDPCLQRAIDLLLSLHALQQRQPIPPQRP